MYIYWVNWRWGAVGHAAQWGLRLNRGLARACRTARHGGVARVGMLPTRASPAYAGRRQPGPPGLAFLESG